MMQAKSLQEVEISAVITRKDGTVVDLGVVAYKHRSKIKTLLWRLRNWWHKRKVKDTR